MHHLSMLQVSSIHHLYLGQFDTLIAFLQLHQSVLPCHGVMVAFQRWCCSTQQHRWCFSFFSHLSPQHDGHTARMIAGSWVLLLIRCFVLLVNDNQSQTLEREKHGRTGTKDNIIWIL